MIWFTPDKGYQGDAWALCLGKDSFLRIVREKLPEKSLITIKRTVKTNIFNLEP